MNEEIKLTSEEWNNRLCKKLGVRHIIMDPDGWDRRNYQYSFYEEPITKTEFNHRLMQSTIMGLSQDYSKIIKEL